MLDRLPRRMAVPTCTLAKNGADLTPQTALTMLRLKPELSCVARINSGCRRRVGDLPFGHHWSVGNCSAISTQ